jgi:aspartyl aminopeptidase
VVQGGSLVAWIQSESADGYLVVGAHTDSPNLRVRTRPDLSSGGFAQIGMEIYGGVLLNSWLDRDLSLAGRVSIQVPGSTEPEERLYLDEQPLLRIPQLAIHLDREIRDKGLKLDPQQHLTPLWAVGEGSEGDLRDHVGQRLGVDPESILAWDLMAYDTQPPAIVGRDRDLVSAARIDNLVSAFCATRALTGIWGEVAAGDLTPSRTPVLVLYDHEEIGSETATGAAGPMLGSILERIGVASGMERADYLASMNRSLVVSADGAHATNPNYVERHEPSHHIAINDGVVIKRNANQRYATDASGEAFLVGVAKRAEVPIQYYIHRNDLPCGSTIGPITAARLGVSTVDIGVPQLAMHSTREMAGLADLDHLSTLLGATWSA